MRSCFVKGLALAGLLGVLLLGVGVYLVYQHRGAVLTTLLDANGSESAELDMRSKEGTREWTDQSGRKLDAVLVSATERECLLRVVRDQRVYRLPLSRLSPADRKFVETWKKRYSDREMFAVVASHWPARVTVAKPPPIRPMSDSEGAGWETRHFQIAAYSDIDPETLEAVAKVCESIESAIQKVPLPLTWGRPTGERERIKLYPSRAAYQKATGAKYFQAHYDTSTRMVHLPVSVFQGVDYAGLLRQFTLEKRADYNVMTHELIHQVVPSTTGSLFPAWVAEGLSEYFSAMQEGPASFSFVNPQLRVRNQWSQQFSGVVGFKSIPFFRMESFAGRDLPAWNTVTAKSGSSGRGQIQYMQALMMVEYFCHGEGNRMRPYMEAVLTGVPESEAARIHLLEDQSWYEMEKELVRYWDKMGVEISFVASPTLGLKDLKRGVGWSSRLTRP